MTATAQSGLFGFGPQPAKGTLAHSASTPRVFRHRAADIDLSAIDDVRIGPPEVGGLAVPTFPYKAGQLVQGGATIYPRLANYFGWLLYGALGYNTSVGTAIAPVHASIALTASAAEISTTFTDPTNPCTLAVVATLGGALPLTGAVTITGTDVSDAALVETVYLPGGTTPVYTSNIFKTVTKIAVPAQAQAGDAILVNAGLGVHTMRFNPTEGQDTKLPWMTFYKYIPGDQSSADPSSSDLYEIYKDCKVTGLTFTLPNDAPVQARVDVTGCGWTFADTNPNTSWSNTLEDYMSIPVGCKTGGYIKIPSYSSDELPVVSCQVGIVNTPLDPRQEKVYGSPELDDITIIGRAMSLDLVLKWKDPALYRKIYTGSTTGLVWTEKPFVNTLDIMAQVPMGESDTPWSVRIQAPAVLLQSQQGVRLAGQNAVMMRLTGQVLAPAAGDYVTLTLTNPTAGYTWPTT